MLNRTLTVFAALAAGLAGIHPASAQTYYPPPPGYSQPLQPAPYGASPGRHGPNSRTLPDFDVLEEDDPHGGPGSMVLTPPGYQRPDLQI